MPSLRTMLEQPQPVVATLVSNPLMAKSVGSIRDDVSVPLPIDDPVWAVTVTPPDRFTVEHSSRWSNLLDTSGPSDQMVYEVMALKAFERLDTELRQVFFGPG